MVQPQKVNKYLFFFLYHSDLVLWGITWSGKRHTLMGFQRSEAYEKGDMGMTLKYKICSTVS